MTVRWRWRTPADVAVLCFAIAWDSFLLFWYLGPPARDGGAVAILFPLIHVAAGIGITYRALAGLLNRTSVSVVSGELRIRHAPLPWRSDRTIRTDDLKQLYVEENRHQSDDRTWYSYDLCALLEDGRQTRLVRKLTNKGQAHYLERAFETRLRIKHRPVAGEAAK